MSEYIMEYLPDTTCIEREEIVRCRDCVYYDITGEEHRLYSDKVYCEKLWKYVEPDGFCAWAVKRTGAENG